MLVANFMLFFGFWLLIPVLPFYLTEVFGCTPSSIGLILSCYTVSALCMRPFSGYLLDTFSRKPLYLMAYFVFTSMFLGYILATTSIQGLFKFYAMISFAVPFIILGLPIFDTGFAIIRRLLKGQSPLQADRGHVHHRLIDLGFDQKQSVAILYAFSALMGLTAVLLARTNESKLIFLAIAVLICFFLAMSLMSFEKRHRKDLDAQLEKMQQDAVEDAAKEEDPS